MALSMVYYQITHRLGTPHYVWDEYLYGVLEKVEVRVTVSVTVCVVLLCCMGWWWKEGRRWNPVPAHSLLFSKCIENNLKQYLRVHNLTLCWKCENNAFWWPIKTPYIKHIYCRMHLFVSMHRLWQLRRKMSFIKIRAPAVMMVNISSATV